MTEDKDKNDVADGGDNMVLGTDSNQLDVEIIVASNEDSNRVVDNNGDCETTSNSTHHRNGAHHLNRTQYVNETHHRNGTDSSRNNEPNVITSSPVIDIQSEDEIENGNTANIQLSVCQIAKTKLRWLYRYLVGPVHERQTWKNNTESVLSHIGYAVGLGNMWRFPYYCYVHGGATFLLAYGVCLLTLSFPMFIMDVSLAQYLSLGPTNVYSKIAPLFSGVGWSMVATACIVSIYYNVVLAWTLLYLFSSFKGTLPWTHCENTFNSPDCSIEGQKQYTAAKEFFNNYIIRIYGSEEDESVLHPGLVASLAVAWFLIILCLVRGIRSSAKVVYITVTFPYAVLILLLVWSYSAFDRTSMENSVHQYFSPTKINCNQLLDINLWADAAAQSLFTLGTVFGGHSTLSSYNTLEQNVLWNSCFIVLWDTATSFLCGCVVFTSLSQLASEMNVNVNDIFSGKDTLGGIGVELVFIAYPALLGKVSPIWSVLFFLMILALGIDSMIGFVETITTALFDNFVRLRQRYLPVVCLVCVLLFLLGLPLCTRSGVFIVELMHVYTCKISMLILGLLKVIVVCYVYGFSKLIHLMREYLKVSIPLIVEWYLAFTLRFFTPILFALLLLWTAVFEDPQEWDGAPLPWGHRALGWLLAIALCLIVPAMTVKVLYTNRDRDWRELLKPTNDFLPKYLRQEPDEPQIYILRDRDIWLDSAAGHELSPVTTDNLDVHENNDLTRTSGTQLHGRHRRQQSV